jgi:hypothetical protein
VTFGSHVTTTKKKAREKAGHGQISTYKNVFFNIFTLLMFKIRQQLTKIKSIALCKTAFIDDVTVNTTSKCCTRRKTIKKQSGPNLSTSNGINVEIW